jgi:dihydrodipicolinate synthase/N-acetylneuraminate lyase
MVEHSKLSGVLPVFQTPFHTDESIDWETLDVELNWLLDQGANGVVMAMVSEILRLSHDERQQMAEHVCRTVFPRGAVVISVGAESSHTAVSLAKHAEQAGATAIMAIPPISIACAAPELHSYYCRLLESTRIPVIVQDASGYVGKPMPISAQAALLHKFGPDRVLYKPEAVPLGPNLTALREASGGVARIFEGSGGIALVDSFRRGIVGTMPGADLIDGIVALWKALEVGDSAQIDRISLPLSALIALQSGLDGFLAIEKYLLKRQGIFRNTIVRGPTGFQLDDETRREVDRLFDQFCQVLAQPAD